MALIWRSLLVCVCAIFSTALPVAAQSQVKLPPPVLKGQMSVEAAIVNKKTVRNFTSAALTQEQVSQLLWAANGNVPADAVSGATAKVIPSAGGLYPLEIYLATGNDTVKGVPAGIYRYEPGSHSLIQAAAGDQRQALAAACLSQMWLARAPVTIVISAVFARTTAKYGNRGVQYVFMEAGNSNQNLYLQAEALGLRVGTVGAFQDGQVTSVLGLPAGVTPLLVMGVGK